MISRVNRVFRDKPHGLIVDYIGIGDELRAATNSYTGGGGNRADGAGPGSQIYNLRCRRCAGTLET